MDDDEKQLLDEITDLTRPGGMESYKTAAQKYAWHKSKPISWNCNVCGKSVNNSRDWLLHHFSDWHRQVIKWVDSFREDCINQRDEDAMTKFADVINAVKDSVVYSQELFEVNGDLFCCVCACRVVDVVEHLRTLKHNELTLNVVNGSALTAVKDECLKNNAEGDVDYYHEQILRRLVDELPPTADSTLEIVVLKTDDQFYHWFESNQQQITHAVEARRVLLESVDMASVSAVASTDCDHQGTSTPMEFSNEPGSPSMPSEVENSPAAAEDATRPSDEDAPARPTVKMAEILVPESLVMPAVDGNNCKVCGLKFFSRETFLNHCKSEPHAKNLRIYDFLISDGKFVIGPEPATAQAVLEATTDNIIGGNDIYELCVLSSNLRIWICGVCFCGVEDVGSLIGHMQSVKHKKRYVELRFPSKMERFTNKAEIEDWLRRVVSDVASLEGKGKVKHAVVASDIPDILNAGFTNAAVETEPSDDKNTIVAKDNSSAPPAEDAITMDSSNAPTTTDDATVNQTLLPSTTVAPSGQVSTKKATAVKPYASATAASKEKPAKEISMSTSTMVLQCEICWEFVMTTQASKEDAWRRHISTETHKKKKKLRQGWNFDPALFTKRDPSKAVIDALVTARSHREGLIVGLDDIIEIMDGSKKKGNSIKLVCLTCTETMKGAEELSMHFGRIHLMKYVVKYYASETIKRFKDPAKATYSELVHFLVEQDARGGIVRVYEPRAKDPNKPAENIMKKTMNAAAAGKSTQNADKTVGPESSGTKVAAKSNADDDVICTGEVIKSKSKASNSIPKQPNSAAETAAKNSPNTGKALSTSISVTAPQQPRTVAPADKPEKVVAREDSTVKVLMESPTAAISQQYAFAQPILDACKDALVGVEFVYEFCCRDISYEPAYLCKLCQKRCRCHDLIAHLTSVGHRLKYFEKKCPGFCYSLTTSKQSDSAFHGLAIKQQAELVEKSYGRQRISQRLTRLIDDPATYGMRKNASAPGYIVKQVPPPAMRMPPATAIVPPLFATEISPPPFPVNINSGAFSMPMRRPMMVNREELPPGVSLDDNVSCATTVDRLNRPPGFLDRPPPPPPGCVAMENTSAAKVNSWSKKCDLFVAQLLEPKGVKQSTSTKPMSSPTKASGKSTSDSKSSDAKNSSSIKKKDTREKSEERKKRRSRSSSRSRSRSEKKRQNAKKAKRSSSSSSSSSDTKKKTKPHKWKSPAPEFPSSKKKPRSADPADVQMNLLEMLMDNGGAELLKTLQAKVQARSEALERITALFQGAMEPKAVANTASMVPASTSSLVNEDAWRKEMMKVTAPKQQPVETTSRPAPIVIDYGHGSRQPTAAVPPRTVGQAYGISTRQKQPATDSNSVMDFIQEAMRNVEKAQSGTSASSSQFGMSPAPMQRPRIPVDFTRPPPPFGPQFQASNVRQPTAGPSTSQSAAMSNDQALAILNLFGPLLAGQMNQHS